MRPTKSRLQKKEEHQPCDVPCPFCDGPVMTAAELIEYWRGALGNVSGNLSSAEYIRRMREDDDEEEIE